MAAPSINSKIKLDGEREYKAALAEIKSGLNVLKSELNLASEQFRDNADSVEALAKKNDILDRTILTQKEKIEQALSQCNGDTKEACKQLGVSRATLYRYLNYYNIQARTFKAKTKTT